MESLSTRLGSSKKSTPTRPKLPRNPYAPQVSRVGATPRMSAAPAVQQNNLANILGMQQQTRNQGVAPSLDIKPNFVSDPILARIQAMKGQNMANARTEAEALRKQAVIESGLADVGQEIGLDANTLEAARQNPFSAARKIQDTSVERGRELDEALNQGNLFFSGHRANELGRLGRNTAEAQTDLGSQLRSLLGGVSGNLLAIEQEQLAAEQEALERSAAEQRQAALMQAYLDSLNAAMNPPAAPGTSVESGAGGFVAAPGAPNTGGVSYAAGPTPAQVENMISSGIDPATAIYAPQPETIYGPNSLPEVFGGEPTTVGMPTINAPAGWDTNVISGGGTPIMSLPAALAAPAGVTAADPYVQATLPTAPVNYGAPDPWQIAQGVAPLPAPAPSNLTMLNPADPYEMDNLMWLLALQSGQNSF